MAIHAGTPSSTPGVIVATKLHVPEPPRRTVPREALVQAVTCAEDSRLTLFVAPAGSGKTTLLSAWHAAPYERRPFAWLSLDEEDNDPAHFWDCVIAALATIRPDVGQRARAALHAPGTSLIGTVVPLLINDVGETLPSVVLVLDDYHVISSREVHSSVAYLLDFLPANLHVAIASRSDPSLPVGQIRARGQLTEIRTRELRFNSHDASAMLSALGLELAPTELEQLLSRTEGWAAGLQLAGLSLRGREHPGSLIAALAGDDRQITEYLGVEVLDSLPEELLSFLLRTSVLERLHPSLCNAITGASDARALLAEAERRSLFLTRLDFAQGWFAYHQLFRDLLRHRLEIEHPTITNELHRRAARWYAPAGYAAEAIGHAIAGGDLEHAGELVGAHWNEFFNRGRVATVSRWLAALPDDLVAADSRLWLATVWTAMDRGRLDEVRPWLERPAAQTTVSEDAHEREAWRRLLRGLHSFKTGELRAAVAESTELREGAAEYSAFWRTVAGCLFAITLWWVGDPSAAATELGLVVALAEADQNSLAAVYALGYLALIEVDRGRDTEADGYLVRFDELVGEEPQLDEHFTAMVAHVARGRLLQRAGNPAAAIELQRACELAARGAGILERAYAELALARLELAAEEAEEAESRMERVRRLLAGCEELGVLDGAVNAKRTPAAVLSGDELSDRERGVLRLLRTEMSLREISSELYVSLNTTKTHVKRIYLKLGVSSRAAAVQKARELEIN
ncbi:MAG TPA: LuxR C-terminal-related transcriptional regulator [Solirubrobacteraceae bacterium]|nr:LuxR C-terminal-related transcriptional regulator [Solirubrobacteraceae bacterium]